MQKQLKTKNVAGVETVDKEESHAIHLLPWTAPRNSDIVFSNNNNQHILIK